MPDYQKQGQENGAENGENGAVAVYKAPNMMANAVKNNQGKNVYFKAIFKEIYLVISKNILNKSNIK